MRLRRRLGALLVVMLVVPGLGVHSFDRADTRIQKPVGARFKQNCNDKHRNTYNAKEPTSANIAVKH